MKENCFDPFSMAMQSILLTATQLLICLSIDMTESLQRGERSALTLQSTSKNCTKPKPTSAGAMFKWQAGRDNNVFVPGEKAEFVCQDGFRQIGWLETLTCQKDGNWSARSGPSFEDDFKSESSSGEIEMINIFWRLPTIELKLELITRSFLKSSAIALFLE